MYTLSRGASGLQGPPTATLLDGSGIIASPLLVPHVTTSACAPGRTRTIYQSDLIVPTTAGNIFDLAQNRNGAISIAQQEAITTSGLLSAPAGITDLIFFGGMNNTIYAMTTSGTIVWQYPTLGFVASGPAISNGRIYVGSVDNNLYAFSLNGQ
jgi:outer membrane protein assembly factor BamB